MSNTYVIHWKSKVSGRSGRGTKQFTLEQAEGLAHELNREYPNIHHELLEVAALSATQSDPSAAAGEDSAQEAGDAGEQPSDKTHAFSE